MFVSLIASLEPSYILSINLLILAIAIDTEIDSRYGIQPPLLSTLNCVLISAHVASPLPFLKLFYQNFFFFFIFISAKIFQNYVHPFAAQGPGAGGEIKCEIYIPLPDIVAGCRFTHGAGLDPLVHLLEGSAEKRGLCLPVAFFDHDT